MSDVTPEKASGPGRGTKSTRSRPREKSQEKVMMRGLEAIGECALRAGMTHFFGTPETPQTELFEYLSLRMPSTGGTFICPPDERVGMGMTFGAACAGARAMSAGTGPGLARMQEVLSYMCACEVGSVLVHVSRGGPGFGNILPAQSDYFLVTRGNGNGDARSIVLAPSSVQEAGELTMAAFHLADSYRTPVIVTVDAMLAQMMEPVSLPPRTRTAVPKSWALRGRGDGRPQVITSIYWTSQALEEHNFHLYNKYHGIAEEEMRYEEIQTRDADVLVVAYGSMGRVAKTAIEKARKRGLKIGLFRPVTLWPFPARPLAEAARGARSVLVVELSTGQMLEDVKLALSGQVKTAFYGRTGGDVPSPFEVMHEAVKLLS